MKSYTHTDIYIQNVSNLKSRVIDKKECLKCENKFGPDKYDVQELGARCLVVRAPSTPTSLIAPKMSIC